jgi:hypothetical protein
MSNILKFIRPDSAFDPDTLTILGDVYDRACARYCGCRSSPACDEMANRIFAAAIGGERDPDMLWQIAVRGTTSSPGQGASI